MVSTFSLHNILNLLNSWVFLDTDNIVFVGRFPFFRDFSLFLCPTVWGEKPVFTSLTSSSSSSMASPVKYRIARGTMRSRMKWPISKSAARIASESSSWKQTEQKLYSYGWLCMSWARALHHDRTSFSRSSTSKLKPAKNKEQQEDSLERNENWIWFYKLKKMREIISHRTSPDQSKV